MGAFALEGCSDFRKGEAAAEEGEDGFLEEAVGGVCGAVEEGGEGGAFVLGGLGLGVAES